MIGKPEWFKRRKYGGWGLVPATWQGWAYILVFIVIVFGVQYIPGISQEISMVIIAILAVLLFTDTMYMMVKMKKDERETLHEAIAERNALWVMILVLAIGVAYQTARSVILNNSAEIDPVIIIALVAALIAKAVTNYYLDKRN